MFRVNSIFIRNRHLCREYTPLSITAFELPVGFKLCFFALPAHMEICGPFRSTFTPNLHKNILRNVHRRPLLQLIKSSSLLAFAIGSHTKIVGALYFTMRSYDCFGVLKIICIQLGCRNCARLGLGGRGPVGGLSN